MLQGRWLSAGDARRLALQPSRALLACFKKSISTRGTELPVRRGPAGELGIPADIPNHASYIQSWLKPLKDSKHVFRAAAVAQKIVDMALAFHPGYSLSCGPTPPRRRGGDTNDAQKPQRGLSLPFAVSSLSCENSFRSDISHNMSPPLIDPTAKQAAFQKLYHYQTFRTDSIADSKEYLRATLQDRRLFFGHPHGVNDPWDCKPFFDYVPMLENRAEREQMITFLRATTPQLFNHPLRPVYEQMLLSNDDDLKKAVESWTKNLQAEIAYRRIYCLTPFPKNTLMWSHYADSHRGICIEFDKNNNLISKARPIKYCKEYEALTATRIIANPLQVVLTKAVDWCYEREWRIIGSFTQPGPTFLDGNYVNLPDGAITAIIVGCENPFFDEVVNIVSEFAPTVEVKRAVRRPNRYELEIVTPMDTITSSHREAAASS
jgi:hypothetical protein